MKYQPIIGLEIHIQLKTKTKMFCSCKNGFGLQKEPNINVCPICLGHPGTLPTINKEAVKLVIKTALALNCEIQKESFFERKNYFYPDLPKGYQISQYVRPPALNGYLDIRDDFSKMTGLIRIRRIHLEEDTGRLIHSQGADYSLVDFNRAGVPLMELVTEPDIGGAKEAKRFCEELQMVLRYLDVSDADMEKGQMRCEVNISLKNQELGIRNQELGTKVEVKNLNSFRAVERAIEYETKRQSEILEKGEKIIQETRGWDEIKGITKSQREKEESHDYRYFPEPDLPPLANLSESAKIIKQDLPELPNRKRFRLSNEYGLPPGDIEVLVQNQGLADYFEKVCSEIPGVEELKGVSLSAQELNKLYKLSANYLINEIPRIASEKRIAIDKLYQKVTPENLAEFIVLIYQGKISSSTAQLVLREMCESGNDPSHIIDEKGLLQLSDEGQLEEAIKKVMANNQKVIDDYQRGKQGAMQFLIGQVMKETKGKGDPVLIKNILEKKLKIVPDKVQEGGEFL